jgi:fatty-acyl-CoA synthase
MLGYWCDPAQTDAAIDRAGWMHTGDLATMDDAGYLQIVGRSKDLIIRGGENIYPREIEEYLYAHPAVSDVQVVGIPDERYGEVVVAFVRREADAELDADAVREHCRGRIAHFKVPSDVLFVAEFPMTVTGKVQKFKLREQAIAELGRG